MINLTVCNLGLLPYSTFLPYLYARLRTYIEIDFDKEIDIEWQLPIFKCYDENLDCEKVLEGIDIEKLDFFLTSNYTWNVDDQIELSKYIKSKNPNCFVIAGGPEIPWRDEDVFKSMQVADAVCYAEIEQVMPTFLYNWQNGLDIDIDGIVLKSNPTKPRTAVPKIECKDFIGRPYTHLKNELQTYVDEVKNAGFPHRLTVIMETNRGCPYGCTFCDWGSATLSKIKKFDKQYVLDEIDTAMQWKPDLLYFVDANFGIFPDDLDYVNRAIEHKRKNDYVTTVAFSSAKNKKKYAVESHIALAREGMSKVTNMGIQHTDPEVSRIMDRDNIKAIESLKEINAGLEAGIPCVPTLIVGSPGDSIDKWKMAVTDMMRMTFHDDVRLHDFQLLPNAPAMDPEYMEKYKIKYITKTYHEMANSKRKPSPAKYIAETFSYTIQDYVHMQKWSWIYLGLHTLGVFKWPAMLAHHTLNIDYLDFYDRIVTLPSIKKMVDTIYSTMHDFVLGDKVNKFIYYQDRNMQLDTYLYIKCLEDIDNIYEEFKAEFADDFGDYIDDVIAFSKFIQITYNHLETEIELSYNFKDYYKSVLSTPALEKTTLKPIKEQTRYFNDGDIGYYKEYNLNKYLRSNDFNFEDYKEYLLDKLTRIAPNYRHRLYYFYGVLEN